MNEKCDAVRAVDFAEQADIWRSGDWKWHVCHPLAILARMPPHVLAIQPASRELPRAVRGFAKHDGRVGECGVRVGMLGV